MEVRTIIFGGRPGCNPDKSAVPLSGQKVPFQDQAFPTVMTDVPQTDVSRPSALPTANLLHRGGAQSIVDQNSAEYLDGIEEEWNKKVDMEVETLVDGMVDLVSLASVRSLLSMYNQLLTFYKMLDRRQG